MCLEVDGFEHSVMIVLSTCTSESVTPSSATLGEAEKKKIIDKLFIIVDFLVLPNITYFSLSVTGFSKLKMS